MKIIFLSEITKIDETKQNNKSLYFESKTYY